MPIFIISLVTGVGLSIAWYALCRRYNRRKASKILRWIESALAGEGKVLGMRWITPSQFKTPLRLTSRMFHRAWIHVDLAPRQTPIRWLFRTFRREPETIVFQADLDTPPLFALEIQNFRSFARSNRSVGAGGPEWNFIRTQPFVISSGTDWQKEVTSTLTSLAASGSRDYLSIRFRRSSPHFCVTLPLEAISPETAGNELMLDVMRELATKSSAKLF
jgi:hypothetical protein